MRAANRAVAPAQTWYWKEWLSGSAAALRREAEELAAAADGAERRLEIWEGAMEDGAAKAMRCLYPGMSAREQEEGARACVLAAWQGAKPGDPLVELAMALVLEWGAMTRPWQSARARAHALRLVRTGEAPADWFEGTEEGDELLSGVWTEMEERAEEAAGDDGAGAASGEESAGRAETGAGDGENGAVGFAGGNENGATGPAGADRAGEEAGAGGAGEARHRVKIRTRRRRRRRHQSVWTWFKEWAGHEIWRGWNILATFAQRVRYGMTAWRYRR